MLNKNILYIIAQQNFRDEEYFTPREILENEGMKITTASITREDARGVLGRRAKPDISVREANVNDFDCLVIAGGPGSPRLADYPEVLNIVRKFNEQKKPIASICLAGYILARSGILNGRAATVFPADFALAEYRRSGVNYSEKRIVVDKDLITATGPEDARGFAEAIIKLLSK